MSEKLKVYVQLLDEGTICYRPTTAVPQGEGLFILEPTVGYESNDETWEFLPGSAVALEEKLLSSGIVKVAVSPEEG